MTNDTGKLSRYTEMGEFYVLTHKDIFENPERPGKKMR